MSAVHKEVYEYLKEQAELEPNEPNKQFPARELAEYLFKVGRFTWDGKRSSHIENKWKNYQNAGRGDDKKFVYTQLTSEISQIPNIKRGGEKVYPNIEATEGDRPRLFSYSEARVDTEEQKDANDYQRTDTDTSVSSTTTPLEDEFYPNLVKYLYSGLRVFSRYIPHSGNVGQKSGVNHWLYPDVVGAEDLTENLGTEVKEVVYKSNSPKIKLWSFEVKRNVDIKNLRECFFQTVANSSWANVAYLVTKRFEGKNSRKIEQQLRILCKAYGIGCIIINLDNYAEGQILIPAEEREVNWDMANALADNEPFAKYLGCIKDFYRGEYECKLEKSQWGIKESKEEDGLIEIKDEFLPPRLREREVNLFAKKRI